MAQSKYGRPMKGKTRRTPVTIQVAVGLLDIIDEYVEERDAREIAAYSRSDFFNEALRTYMKAKGMLPASDEKK